MKEFKVIALSEEEFSDIIIKHLGMRPDSIDYDMGLVGVDFSIELDYDLDDIMAKEFGADKAYTFSSDTDQEFPSIIMVMLDFNPYLERRETLCRIL